jgi:iron complex transport system permease protein
MLTPKKLLLWMIPVPVLLVLCLLAGSSGFGLPDISTLTGRALLDLRLCRLATGFVVGAALAMSGCALQAVLRNALAEPSVLGISSGGSLGAALVIASGLSAVSPLILPAGAFFAAAATLLLVCLLANRVGNYAPNTLILTGVVVSSMLSSFLMLVLSFVKLRVIHSITWWLLGNLQATSWPLVSGVALLVLVAFIILFTEARTLNALLLGHETAHNLGVSTRVAVPLILAAATLAAAAAVSISGIIGFVGLIVPHALRRLTGANHRLLLPCTALFGGTFLMLCDTLARTLAAPHEIPVGVVTSLLGGPFFLYLLTRKGERAFR